MPRTHWTIAAFVGLLVLATGVASLAFYLRERHVSYFSDADTIRRPIETTAPRDVLWRSPATLPVPINTAADEHEPSVTADGLDFYFVRGTAGQDTDIYYSELSRSGWSAPQPMATINTEADELGPAISPDGATLYFASNRAGGVGEYDLWMSHRDGSDGWSQPVNLGPRINSRADDYGPALTPDGTLLYFSSNRSGRGDFDLFVTGPGNPGLPVEAASALNTEYDETAPAVSPAGDFVYFGSNRPGGEGGLDLYRARRFGGDHADPRTLGTPVNTPADELDPALSLGGFALHFASNEGGQFDLRYTTSREVFTDTESYRATIDWASLWPYLIWLAVTVLMLLLLAMLLKRLEYRRLNLLAKCLMVSLLVHALLLLSFVFWGVSAALSEWNRPGRGTRVMLVSPSIGMGVGEQIRGELTSVEMSVTPPAPTEARERSKTHESVEAARAESPAPPRIEVAASPLEAEPLPAAGDAAREAPAADFTPAALTAAATAVEQSQPVPVNLPAASGRSAQAESEAALPSSAIQTSMAPRTESRTPDAVPTEQGPVFEALPTAELGEASSVARMADAATQRGAPPPAPPMPATSAAPRSLPREMVALSLPAAAAAAQAPAGEDAAPQPEVEVLGDRGSAAEVAALVVQETTRFAADPGVATPAGDPAASASSLADVDAQSANAPATDLPHTAATIERLDAIALDLPALEETPAAAEAAEAVPLVAAATATSSTRDSRVLPPAAATKLRADEAAFEPSRRALEFNEAEPLPMADPADARPLPTPEVALPDVAVVAMDLDLDLPTAVAPDPYAQRAPERREEIVEEMGGSVETERAVAMALDWLARHQGEDGAWDGDHFDDGCGQCGGTQRVRTNIALTGLSLLCFLAADHTHTRDGPYRENVSRGLRWLLSEQSHGGSLMTRESMYSHGIAVIALAEAYGMTGDPKLARPLERATDFIYEARNTQIGGWRYRPGQIGDTSVMGWQIMALTSARRAGIDIPPDAFDVARDWLELVHRRSRPGLYAYQPNRDVTPAMTAEGMFVNQLLGVDRADPRMRGSALYIIEHLPDWQPDANTYYWYYATLALFQHQGPAWERWNEAVTEVLLANQRITGPAAGSWDPDGQWAGVAGRVYQTAIATLTLEVYYRYLPLYVVEPEPE